MTEELKQAGGEAEGLVVAEDSTQSTIAPVIGGAGDASLLGQAARVIAPPAAGETSVVRLSPGERFELAANPANVNLTINGNNLVLGFDLDGDGTPDSFVVLEDLVLIAGSGNPPVLMMAGEPIGVDLLIGNALALAGSDVDGPGAPLEVAAGPEALGSGVSSYSDNLGDTINLLVAQGVIPPVELEFRLIELEDQILIPEESVTPNSPPEADPVLTPASRGELPPELIQALNALGLGDSPVPIADLEAFLGVPAGSFSGIGGTEGSAMKITFSGEAGDAVSFDWNFLTDEATPSGFNDSAYIVVYHDGVLLGFSLLADTNSTFFFSSSIFNEETGYTTLGSVLAAGGTYTVGLVVFDVGDTIVDSGLLVDNFQINGSVEGFESGSLAGWEVLGNVTVVDGTFQVTPTEGDYHGLLSTGGLDGGEGGGELPEIVFYKQFVVDGEIGDDDTGVIADFGGADAETSLENLVFTLLSNPTFGQLILVTGGGDTSFLTPGDTFSSEDTIWWIATQAQIDDFLSQPGAPEFLPDVNFDYSVTDEAGATATAPVIITLPPPDEPRTALGVEQGTCLREDTEGALLFNASPTDGNSKISQIVISGFPIGDVADAWVVDASSVNIFGYTFGVDYTASYDPLTGDLTIDFVTASFSLGEPINGTVNVTPNPDSDVDRTLTIEATAINGAGSAVDIEDSVIPVDAVADGAAGSAGDDGDGFHLSVMATLSDSDDDGDSFQPDEIGTLNIKATFDDFLDGSETHTIQVFAPDGFTILEIDEESLPEGVTLISNDGSIAIFDVETLNGVGSVDFDIQVQNTGAEEGQSDFLVRAMAEETNTGDIECVEGGEGGLNPVAGDNVAFVEATAPATVADVAPPEVSLSLYGGADCIEEDSLVTDFNNQVTVTVTPDGDDLLTQIVISGFQSDWTYDLIGLDTDGGGTGVVVTDNIAGDGTVTITFDPGTNATYNGTFSVQPPADSDIDHPTLTATASVVDPVDDTLTDEAAGELDIYVDANADAVTVSISVSDSDDAGDSFQQGETGSVTVNATFGDYLDGSEVHTVTVFMPAGFSYDATSVTGIPTGTTVDDSDPTKIVFTVPTDALNGTGSFSATFDVTNDSAGEGNHTFDAEARAVEQNTNMDPLLGDVECDISDADNVATAADDATVAVAGIVSPTVSINLEGDATYIKEDSVDNVVEFNAATGDASDELTTLVITFPPEVEAGHVDFSGILGDLEVSNVDVDDNGGVGPVVVTITFNPGVTSYSGDFLLDAPVEDSDVDLGDITIVANVQDQVDNSLTDSANATLQIAVDAVLDEALDPGADSDVVETETAGPQTINLGLTSTLGSAGFAGSGDGGADTDGSESITIVLVLNEALPAGVVLSSTGGTVTQDLLADPSGKTYIVTGADLEAAIDGLQVELPASFEGVITGTVTVTSKEANTPEGEVPASGDEPDTTDNVVVLSADFSVTVNDGPDPRGGTVNLTVDEAALDLNKDGDDLEAGTTTGNNPGSTAETDKDTLVFDAGSDPIVDIYFGATAGIVVEDENGTPINVIWSGSGTDTLTGTLNGVVVIVLSLSGDNTAVAGGTANVIVTATLTDAFPHADGLSGDVTITGIAVSAEDDDGDIGTGTVNVTVLDDVPENISPDKAIVSNSGDASGVGRLDFFDNVGADRDGDVVFVGITDGDVLQGMVGGVAQNIETIDGEPIYLFVVDGGRTLIATTNDSDPNVEADWAFKVTLNPDGTVESQDLYSIDFFKVLDDGAGFSFDDFSVAKAGQNVWNGLDDPRIGDENQNQDILFTGGNPTTDTVNTSATGIGTNNQNIGVNETVRMDFVTNLQLEGVDYSSLAGINFDSHYTVLLAGFTLVQTGGNAANEIDVLIKAFDADDEQGLAFDNFGNDPQDEINRVQVYNALGFLIIDTMVDGTFGDIIVTFEADGSVKVENLLVNYQVVVGTADGFNRLEVTNVSNEGAANDTFDLGGITVISPTSGDDIAMSFDLEVTDGDGDTSAGVLELTTTPNGADIVGTSENEALIGGSGDDIISDGAGNDIIVGGDGADLINLANDGETDILVYTALSEAGDTVTGFDTDTPDIGGFGGDIIDLSDLLDSGGGFSGSLQDAIDDGYVQLIQVGGNAEVWVDLDGSAGGVHAPVLVATLNGVDLISNPTALNDNIVVD